MVWLDCLNGSPLALMSPISPVRALVHAREILDCLAWRLRFLFSLLFMILADSSFYLSIHVFLSLFPWILRSVILFSL